MQKQKHWLCELCQYKGIERCLPSKNSTECSCIIHIGELICYLHKNTNILCDWLVIIIMIIKPHFKNLFVWNLLEFCDIYSSESSKQIK